VPEIFGKNVSNGTIAISAGAAGLLGYAVYRQRKQAAAAAAAAAAAQAPGTGTGTSDQIDPATGFPYGSTQDASALSAQANYQSPYVGGGGGSYGYGYPNSYPTTQPGQFTSNAAWAQAAEQYMAGQGGGDPVAIGNALGKYITGQPVTPDMQSLIEQAIAFEGYPPVSGPNGFPPSVNTANPGSTGSTGTTVPTPSGPVTVNIPDGTGRWEPATFPSQAALNQFYSILGVSGGYYPNGLSVAQIDAALATVSATHGAVIGGGSSGGGSGGGDHDRH
jgi:hypothetical protein